MGSKMQMPELKCMDPENYRKFFRSLCWSGTRITEGPYKRRLKKDRHRRPKTTNTLAVCYAPALLANPSHFAVYATVRRSILARWMYLQGALSEYSDDSDSEETSSQVTSTKIPKITGIGLRTVFSLVSQSRITNTQLCEHALNALLDVLQGHAPEELAQEPTEIIASLQSMLVEVATANSCDDRAELPTGLTGLGTSCLISLAVARGEAELILNAVSSLIMSSHALLEQNIKIPVNLTTLQRCVQTIILGTPSRNLWLNYGVPHQSLVTSFPVDLPSQLTAGSTELVIRALVSDGCYLYVFTSRGLLKIGSGYGSSIKQHVYLYKPDFFPSDRHGWLGCCKNKLYVRIGRKKTEVYEVDKDSLDIRNVIRLDPGSPAPIETKTAVFSDGHQLGMIMITAYDNLTIRLYDVERVPDKGTEGEVTLKHRKELTVPLMRRRTLALGRAAYEDCHARRGGDLEATVAMQLDDNEDDPLVAISAGQDFGLLQTASGKVYYTGKGQSLGYKAVPQCGRWTLMKETIFNKNDTPNFKKFKVVQVALGHEGLHAILVLDNGAALFTGLSRRGEDGDNSKHRRAPKPIRPRKIYRADGQHVVFAACNYGSTALVTKQGTLIMYGKDTQHCDSNGVVQGLRNEKIVQVALGKAHAVALTNHGHVFTFGINNKGQCGREFGYARERQIRLAKEEESKPNHGCQESHKWTTDSCRICVQCLECTSGAGTCDLSIMPGRMPGDKCGCGEGDSGCLECGICRQCAEAGLRPDLSADTERTATDDEEPDSQALDDTKSDKVSSKAEGQTSSSDVERDANLKVSCLPPAKIAVPGGHRVTAVACGLQHTVLLTENGEVLTFGSNQFGQLGAGDVTLHHRIIRVRVPKASAVAAGSNHTAVMTRDGELYTFGNYQKGALGRPHMEEPTNSDRAPVWYATPGRVPKLGLRNACKALWVSASGDQTFVQVSQSLIKTDTLFSSTIIANTTTIIILPNQPEHTFKCITINKVDGVCTTFTGPEQIDFVNTLACLDPLYDVIWCYQPQMRVMKCFNILAFDSHKLQRCCNPDLDYLETGECYYPNVGCIKRLEDFKNLETFELTCSNDDKPVDSVALSNVSILNQELAIPSTHGGWVTRMHAALHLLGCLDSLTYVHDNRLNLIECKRETISSASAPLKPEYLTVTRFDNHGGGWGYSGHSVEAIRFMCDTDILLGGIGLFGGRGDYTAKVKLFDIGHDGGDQEGDGELIAESEEVIYECAPRDRFPIMFDAPIPVIANRWFVAWACINGPSSDCGSAGQAMVINDDVGFHFKTSKKSNNGTDVNAGQIPCLLYNIAGTDHTSPPRLIDCGEPIITLTKNISRKVTVPCFKYLISLLSWSWDTFKEFLLDTNGQVPINYQKLTMMKHQKRLVYVIRACLRLIKSYINEIYPQNVRKRNSHEYMSYFESIGEVKSLIQSIIAEPTPACSMLPRRCSKMRAHRVCYVQFALELTNSVLKQAHDTVTACFHAFFPTPTLKWNHLSMLLYSVTNGVVPEAQVRELTATCAALCASRSLRDVLHYIVPLTQNSINLEENKRPETKIIIVKEVPSKSATVPRSSHAQKPPPIPPRAHQRDNQKPSTSKEAQTHHNEWHLLDIIPILLDIVMIPIKHQMMTRQCGQPHDHGEIKQHEQLSEYCCKLCVRIVAELSYSATNIRDMESHTVKQLVTPSRFMRVNQSRSWNTGNGSPDAICFTVDRPGVMLVGAGVFSGSGTYEYSLELLHDMRQINGSNDDANAANCWVSLDTVQGSFTGAECQNDMAQLKFDKPIPLKEDLRYAIRLCNHGGRTANGDCGLPSVKGPDGTTFRFASCSLSFNGTTLARGQIPCLIYYGSRSLVHSSDSADVMIAALRAITLRVSSIVLERSVELFCTLRNELTAEDLRRNASVLQQSPAINTLIPYTLANLEGLDDSKSVIKLVELIYKLMPHVAAMNLLVPTTEDFITTTTSYYTWVESEHPYRQAGVSNSRVLFPSNVSWVVLEMDPRSVTAQPEDTLTIYAVAGAPKQKCHCQSEIRVADPPFRKVYKRLVQLTLDGDFEEMDDDLEGENACMHYNCTYVSVTPRLANVATDWPQKAILVPGNEVIFSLETTSDYLTEYNKSNSEESRYGFRCLCAGYEDTPLTSQRQGLVALEMELVYAGASCASKLLAPDLDVPPMVFSTLVDVQLHPMSGSSEGEGEGEGEGEVEGQDSSETLLLSRGLELSAPLTVHQVIEGQPLLRCVSTERQFLIDFIAGAESTAGGRLARWLAPTPRVEPTKCELKAPATPATLGTKLAMPILVRDQYGDLVASPSLVVEVVIQKLENTNRHSLVTTDGVHYSAPDVPFAPSSRENSRFLAITMMKAYSNYSFEELRYASGTWGETVASMVNRVPAERLLVRPTDGYYVVQWTPKVAGVYAFRCTLDNVPIAQELTLDVTEISCESEGGGGAGGTGGRPLSPPPRLHRFNAEYSAGLRVRASPCLQSEELGKVPPGEDVAFVEEISNKDGTWVRLSAESLRAYTDGSVAVAWCMQYHRHLEGTLLEPVEPDSPQDGQEMDYAGLWTGYTVDKVEEESAPPPTAVPPPPTAVPPPPLDLDRDDHGEPEPGPSQDPFAVDDSRFPFSIEYEVDDGESGPSPFAYAPEPSKRDRQMRNEAAGASSPRRRSNGNEWWSPVRHRPDNGRDVEPIPEVEMEPEDQPQLQSQQEVNMYRDIQAGVYRDIKNPRWRADCEEKYEPMRRPRGCSPTPEPLPRTPLTPRPDPPSPPTHRPKPEPSVSNKYKEEQNHYKEDLPKYMAKLPDSHLSESSNKRPKNEGMEAVPSSSQDCKLRDRLEPQLLHKKPMRNLPEPMDTTWSPVREVRRTEARRKSDLVPQKLDYEMDNIAEAIPQAGRAPGAGFARAAARAQAPLSPPPLPARTFPVQAPPPRKHALSPAQAECLRAIFAALLWHEGTVHDAIACAAFLKFHPQLPKQGARVVTRAPHDVAPPRHQRHSVEVSNAGKYLQINPSTLETLTRSGIEATSSRQRKSDISIGDTIREEDHTEPGNSTPGVVNVLPPALRALVALWDALYDSDQLSSATDKYKKPLQDLDVEQKVVAEQKVVPLGAIPKKVEWKAGLTSYKPPYAVRCELCGGASVPPPLAAHMRHLHPGCRAPTTRGFDRDGVYKRADPPPAPPPTDLPPSTCGQLAQACQLWYIFCERCRDKAIKAAQAKQSKLKATLNSNDHIDLASMVDHHTMKENAVFLLDLAPLTNSESLSTSPWGEGCPRGPPTPPGSMWQPAPPFQCLPALGAAPKATTNEAARYHSLGRPTPPPVAPLSGQYGGSESIGSQYPRVHRSVSMGQAGGRDLAGAAIMPANRDQETQRHDTLSGAGSSLLAQPSAELQRLVGCGFDTGPSVSAFEPPHVDPDSLIKSPVLSFVLAKRDLPAYRQKMDAAVRINTVRQYAFEAMNWLLRSTTQPTCVHDVMWWFSTSLDKYARIMPPPCPQDDKENVSNEQSRLTTPTASTSAICPGGRSARGSRAAFHAFLGSVSALAPSLAPASAALLQAVRCWALHYSHQDRAFLHRSQVFSVISKILSHPEDGYEDGMLGALHESFHSYLNKENYVWSCPDVTGWCDISVSSRQGMAGSLTDGSTETFWESGDEDRNKAKWIQVTFAGGTLEDRPHIICVHVDNTRDTMNKIHQISFMYSGGSGEMYHMHDMEIDLKAAAWLCYTLPTCYPGVVTSSVRVRCELRGTEPAVRVRQVRVLSAPVPLANQTPAATRVLHALTEGDTLRVFRLLTSQVFGKLLEFEQPSSESGDGAAADDAPADDTDLREHVVGILFAGHQLTSLQRQVMSHIVCAIGAEAARVRDDWETALICAETLYSAENSMRPVAHQMDNYCFEMLSLLLALSGSKIGRSHLAQQTELLADLLALLHTGSDRVQRQVISLLRRMIIEIPPQKMLAIINQGHELSHRVTLMDHLLSYLGKAITVQMKVKGSGGANPGSLTMGSNMLAGPDVPWFMRGETTKKHAQLVAKLISDMAEEKVSIVWGIETRTALANYASQIAQLSDGERRPERCVALSTMWMTLAALCVCEQSHIELLNGPEGGRDGRSRDSGDPRPYCTNHDDGTTAALVECHTCGALCAECDRFLHLNRSTRAHHRQICKEEESAIRIDIHEGCGRAKLFWLLLLVDRRTLKGLAEFRMEAGVTEGAVEPQSCGPPGLAGVCRFCGTRGNSGLLAIGNVCADQQCQEYGGSSCNKVLGCSHLCGGVRGERRCLPCLSGCSVDVTLRQDADDMCMICFTDPLQAAPALQLSCGHVFHLHCCKKVLLSRWIGPRITFSFSQCPICKENMSHWTLEELLAPIKRLREEVQKKALMRLEYEGLNAASGSNNAQYDPAKYAMERYAYYVCHKCEKAYFGGLARCEAESNGSWEPSELVCGGCSDVASAKTCPKHGADFLEYKCRYCCSVAVFFCFGTSHFCNACHDDFQRVTNIPRHLLPQCPAGPKCEQLPGTQEECPLHVSHPPTGEEFALGCGVCRHAHAF